MEKLSEIINVVSGDFYNIITAGEDGQFIIPTIQRTYQWEKKEFDRLWEDLEYFLSSNQLDTEPDFKDKRIPPYLLGTIYTTSTDINEPSSYQQNNSKISSKDGVELIDGQQRLTTLSIALISLRHIYRSLLRNDDLRKEYDKVNDNRNETGHYPFEEFITDLNRTLSNSNKTKLKYDGAAENEYWMKLVKQNADFNTILKIHKNDTIRNISYSFSWQCDYFCDKISKHSNDTVILKWDDKNKELKITPTEKWNENRYENTEKVFNKIFVYIGVILYGIGLVRFNWPRRVTTLFDIINNRGKRFTTGDLTRIELLMGCSTEALQNEILQQWKSIHKFNDQLLSNCWNALYADTKNKAISSFNNLIANKLKSFSPDDKVRKDSWIKAFVSNLATCYQYETSIEPNKFKFDANESPKLIFFNLFDYPKFTKPIFFATEKNISDEFIKKEIYSYMISFLTRYAICFHSQDNKKAKDNLPSLAISFCETIRNFVESDLKINTIYKALNEKLSDYSMIFDAIQDYNFKKSFSIFSLTSKNKQSKVKFNSKQVRFGYFVIASIETYLSGDFTKVLAEYGSITEVEHIYPQNPTKNSWPDGKIELELLHNLGNLMPLNNIKNKSIGNSPLQKKITAYNQTNLVLWTKFIKPIMYENSDTPSWNSEKIRKNAEQLSGICCDVFPLPLDS